jgi:hypothetical protein
MPKKASQSNLGSFFYYTLTTSLRHCLTFLGALPADPGAFLAHLAIKLGALIGAVPADLGTYFTHLPHVIRLSCTHTGAGSADVNTVQAQLMAPFHIRLP